MYLRRLEVHGFKSFADRQRFDFGPGMTVVVGPNGSGKSNVSDALRWALGDSSARQIRTRKLEDVIFSGSDERRQLGAAEVSVTLDNAERWMPIDYAEVTVTRRAHRSGDSEYLINGQKVRLTDVQDLFRRAEVGQNSYAMMSQGLVDEVLALRPAQRRELIEEAADVRRHRQQLTLSERRLEETRDNLGRVRMLIREVEPRLRQLERQERRAARYHELDGQLQLALVSYYEEELRRANETLTATRARHDQESEGFRIARGELGRLDARLEQLSQLLDERRGRLEALQAKERECAEEALRLEQEAALAQQRHELLTARRGELERDLAVAPPEQPAEPAGDPAALAVELAEAAAALERERAALASADAEAREVLRELTEAEAQRARVQAERDDAARWLAEHEREHEARRLERQRADAQRLELLGSLRDLGRHALVLQRQGRSREEASAEARRLRQQAERRLEERLRVLIEGRDAVRAAAAHLKQQQERAEMLARLADAVPAGDAARALVAAARAPAEGEEPLTGIVGTIGRLIRVPAELEVAIEAALAEQIGAVVVAREADAVAAIEYLRDHEAGATTLLPLDSIEHNYPLNLFNERGVVGVAARLVRCDRQYRPLVDTLLGRTIVVDDVPAAQRMVKRGLGSVVTRDGVLLRRGGAYYGGRIGAAVGEFSLRHELEETPALIDAARDAEQAALRVLQQWEDEAAAAREPVETARAAVDEAEESRRAHERDIARLRRAQSRLAGEMRLVRRTLAGLDGVSESAGELERRRETASAAAAEIDGRIAQLRDRSQAAGNERDAIAGRESAATARHATTQAALRAERDQQAHGEERRRRERELREQRTEQLQAVRREREDIELSLRDLGERAANARSTLALAQAAVGPQHAVLAEASTEERELRGERGEKQSRLFAAERAMIESEGALRAAATQVQTLTQQLTDDGLAADAGGNLRVVEDAGADAAGIGPATAVASASVDGAVDVEPAAEAVAPVRGGADIDPAVLREAVTRLRGEIRALGPVNVEATEDLSEESERANFLRGQVDDLEAAEGELRSAIRELRALIRERFDETFEQVNTAFGDYFERFFGGGKATLSLLGGEEGEDPGVEIAAQPPGKRIASLNVLSGGERSLTSVALLFALLSVNPAPVCVLDEVDAALDEANVGRFIESLAEMTDRSQFIVISHSRSTIESADAIYGISMGEDSTSRVLSLKLGDLPQAS